VRVKFFAYIRDFTGCKEAELPYRETIGGLARELCGQYGAKLEEKMFSEDGGAFGPDIIVLINGRHVAHLGGLNAPLKPDDTVCVFPMVAGG
jgi:molybdopterin synthase sulfur carrier subunit